MVILCIYVLLDVNTCCKKRAKNSFIRFKQDFLDYLNRYVRNSGVICSSNEAMQTDGCLNKLTCLAALD